jgi:hypothetical protein
LGVGLDYYVCLVIDGDFLGYLNRGDAFLCVWMV